NEHDFVLPEDATMITIGEGIWDEFQKNPQRLRQLKADKPSYFWDELIEKFSGHAIQRSSFFTFPEGIQTTERILRLMAREPRVKRRFLAKSFLELVEKTPDNMKMTRYVPPLRKGDAGYVFLLLPKPIDIPEDEYREARRSHLTDLCTTVRTFSLVKTID
ncbi:MAG TPA: hypothetical protein VJ044_01825, partial [Candidatus Hodarchaeales archaeon]|nr:hypothetical protein [Candidatus Hodarchaeales archaeon]